MSTIISTGVVFIGYRDCYYTDDHPCYECGREHEPQIIGYYADKLRAANDLADKGNLSFKDRVYLFEHGKVIIREDNGYEDFIQEFTIKQVPLKILH